MRWSQSRRGRRRASVTIMGAIQSAVMMTMGGLVIDAGYVIVVHAELQNAADSAALAGASQLLNPEMLKGKPHQQAAIAAAVERVNSEAQRYSLLNRAGNVHLAVGSNLANDGNADIVCGYLADPRDRTQNLVPSNMTEGPAPNSVKVRIRRDPSWNGTLVPFFARILGVSGTDVRASATASYGAEIGGFKIQTPGYDTCLLLPYVLHIDVWNQALEGIGPDQFTRNPATGHISPGSDGIPECKLFPLSNGNGGQKTSGLPPGNFGTVDIGASNNSTADLARQILFGPNAADLNHYPNGTLQLDPSTRTMTLEGDTGISAGVKDELAAIIGKPRIIPLYSQVTGNGNNARYTIVGFAGVTLTEVDLTGSLSSKHLTIQPCFVIEPNAVSGGTISTSWYVTKPLALSR